MENDYYSRLAELRHSQRFKTGVFCQSSVRIICSRMASQECSQLWWRSSRPLVTSPAPPSVLCACLPSAMSLLRTLGSKFPSLAAIEQNLANASRRPIEQVRAVRQTDRQTTDDDDHRDRQQGTPRRDGREQTDGIRAHSFRPWCSITL
jgi:hypothetical protein